MFKLAMHVALAEPPKVALADLAFGAHISVAQGPGAPNVTLNTKLVKTYYVLSIGGQK